MKARRQDFILGIVAIIFVALFVGTVLFVAPSLREDTRPIVVQFRHEDGLAPLKSGSMVLLSGALEVGHVTDVEYREVDGHTLIVVAAEIVKSLPLYGDCEITTDMPLVGGAGTMVIVNVGTPGVKLPNGPITGAPPQGMAAFASVSRRLTAQGGLVDRLDRMLDPDAEGSLLNKVMLSLADVNAMTMELRTQLSAEEQQTLLGKLHLILSDLNATTSAVREQLQVDSSASLLAKVHTALDTVHSSLSEVLGMLTENRPAVRNTLASVEHATRIIDEEMIAKLRAEFDPESPTSLLAKLHVAMDHMNASLADVQVVAESGKRMLLLNRPEVESIVANAKEMSEELSLGVKELRLNPAKLIWGPPSAQADKLGVLTAARDFAQAATYLDDAAARLEAIMELAPATAACPRRMKRCRRSTARCAPPSSASSGPSSSSGTR